MLLVSLLILLKLRQGLRSYHVVLQDIQVSI